MSLYYRAVIIYSNINTDSGLVTVGVSWSYTNIGCAPRVHPRAEKNGDAEKYSLCANQRRKLSLFLNIIKIGLVPTIVMKKRGNKHSHAHAYTNKFSHL